MACVSSLGDAGREDNTLDMYGSHLPKAHSLPWKPYNSQALVTQPLPHGLSESTKLGHSPENQTSSPPEELCCWRFLPNDPLGSALSLLYGSWRRSWPLKASQKQNDSGSSSPAPASLDNLSVAVAVSVWLSLERQFSVVLTESGLVLPMS